MFKLLRTGDKAGFAHELTQQFRSNSDHFLQEIEAFHVEIVAPSSEPRLPMKYSPEYFFQPKAAILLSPLSEARRPQRLLSPWLSGFGARKLIPTRLCGARSDTAIHLSAALVPSNKEIRACGYGRSRKAPALIIGTEAIVEFKDVLGVDEAEARDVTRWAIRVLIEGARR